jgi:hypothetical protein
MSLMNELIGTCAAGIMISLTVIVFSLNVAFLARRAIAGVRQMAEERWM